VTLGIGEVGFAEDVVDVVRRDRDVTVAVPLVRGTITLADDATESLQLFGAELTAEEDLARYGVGLASDRRAALAALNDPHAILVTAAARRPPRSRPGSPLMLAMPRGVGTFTVRGLLAPDGLARVLGSQLVVMDLAAAQTQLVKRAASTSSTSCCARAATSPPRARGSRPRCPPPSRSGTPQTPRARLRGDPRRSPDDVHRPEHDLRPRRALIVYNATATGVVRRAPAIGALRLIGADARRLRRLLLVEAAALGAVGAIAGRAGVVLANSWSRSSATSWAR